MTACVAAALSANAQVNLAGETKFANGEVMPQVNARAERPLAVSGAGTFGLFVFGLATDAPWAQVYAGPTFSPRKWIAMSVGIGTERNAHPWRFGAQMRMAGRDQSLLTIWETGGSGQWYMAVYSHRLIERVNIGLFSQRYSATGPLVEVKTTRHLTLWSAAGPNIETHAATFTVGFKVHVP